MTIVEQVARVLWKWEGLSQLDWNDSSYAHDRQTIMRKARRIVKMVRSRKT